MKYLFAVVCIFLLKPSSSIAQTQVEHRVYDTEFGRFDLWFLGSQITGSYEIAPKKIIGAIRATLNELTATGRWTDPDGVGDIVMTFEEGFEKFRADYRGDKDPDRWYRDQWHGAVRTAASANESPCTGPSYDLIKPFIGTWEEFSLNQSNEEAFIGTLKVQLEAGGCALVQRFVSPDSSFSYVTHGYVNTASGYWEEKYVFSTGRSSDYRWIIDRGDIVQRRVGGSRQLDYLHQLRFTELTESGYLVLQERSNDGGRTWEVTDRTRVKRKR